ncbi:MAG: C40 family peptidase [Actinomycetota bacterium]|nr:C40 family peptidase [Actinomycetota bacterium]
MPTGLVSTLAAPIRRLQALVGPGWSADPATDPVTALASVRAGLADTAAAAGRAWGAAAAGWSGAGAEAAAGFAASTRSAIDDAADRTGRLGTVAGDAGAAVAHARRRLQDILDEFEATAAALEPRIDSPGVARQLLSEAREALGRAVAVIEHLLAELDGHVATLDADRPVPTTPAGTGGSGWGGAAAGPAVPGTGLPPAAGSPGLSGGWSGLAEPASFGQPGDAAIPDAASFGEGVEVRLPDGSVVLAPNAVAADAVRHALTQLGVPYHWGGTTPGVGLDCSGLTQWAYHEAGLNIPRLAQEQDIGAAVAPGALRPGDLAVWDGHVAMVVGNGTMIEAGDPVKLSPIRTSNAGQGFQGFWRPTA